MYWTVLQSDLGFFQLPAGRTMADVNIYAPWTQGRRFVAVDLDTLLNQTDSTAQAVGQIKMFELEITYGYFLPHDYMNIPFLVPWHLFFYHFVHSSNAWGLCFDCRLYPWNSVSDFFARCESDCNRSPSAELSNERRVWLKTTQGVLGRLSEIPNSTEHDLGQK